MCRVLVPAAEARSAMDMPASFRASSSLLDRSVMSKPSLRTDASLVKSEGTNLSLASWLVATGGTPYRILYLRTRAGVTRPELAKATGRSPKMIERYENGKVEPPADVLVKMAARLETTIDELLNLPSRVPSEIRIDGRVYLAAAPANGGGEGSAVADAARALDPAAPPARKPRQHSPQSRRSGQTSPEE